ncbi:MAG: hypothetical protein BWX80_03483 [Candidatus Hydrogenedentes bacterium ADurb.Bin101]|nr:MAG: hypothetical protein BWX80_03483 [Candidatus Hydrogenedentes bacterium ADurb.Bin101]
MVAPGDIGHLAQVFGPRKAVQHDDGLHDMFIDLEAFLFGQGSPADGQVVKFPEIIGMLGNLHLETQRIAGCAILLAPILDKVLRRVPQQRLLDRLVQRIVFSFPFFLLYGQAQAVIKGAHPGPLPYASEPFRLLFRKKLPSLIAHGDELEIRFKEPIFFLQFFPFSRFTRSPGHLFPVLDFGISLKHLKAGADFVQPVMNGFQFGRLVHDIFRGGHFAVVMQPARDM